MRHEIARTTRMHAGIMRGPLAVHRVAARMVWLTCFACGCGASASQGPTDAGGGSRSPFAPASQGAASIHLRSTRTDLCNPGMHWANAPYLAQGGQFVSAVTQPAFELVDGEDGGMVSCTVRQSGPAYDVQAALSAPAKSTTGQTLPSTAIFMRTTISDPASDAAGTLDLIDDRTEAHYRADDCAFSVRPNAGENLAIAPGRIWGRVTCPHLSDPGNASGGTCNVDQGYFILENCGQ